ncbi:UTRA domain-containing protein [Granulosicoccus antarcticus]|uniref:HTH-type transcriptional repressor YvoA n=1 Tax=Granulosicoccus antarcticus IMCC3135 TaxID=1192854 RepID=A0A2Z2NRA5_9GAMM|nr:UTRA domain-containing protein [Granulosicoccus antarcticus]ASJ74036.1 HTH-type transcriptional repressor YvoA [Granulosicoccus antarcticus IMCC3135]
MNDLNMDAPIEALDVASSVPLYMMVKQHIVKAIVAGNYKPGEKLPSESRLVKDLEVSRMTVNRALRELKRDGIITRLQGVGSFVSKSSPTSSLVALSDIRDVVIGRGAVYSCKMLIGEHCLANKSIADLMGLDKNSPIIHVSMLHFSNQDPIQIESRYVREEFAPDLLKQDLINSSMFDYFQSISPVSELEQLVEARTPDASEQKLLQISENTPILRIRRRTWVGPKVVTLGYFSHPGDRYRVTVRVNPADLSGQSIGFEK